MAMTLLLELQTEFSRLEELSLTQLKEDLLTMVKSNYPNRKSFLALSKICLIDLKYFCAHGIIYGGIQTTCVTCGGILLPLAMDVSCNIFKYRCINQTQLRLCCREDLYYKVAFFKWESFENEFRLPQMKQVIEGIMRQKKNVTFSYSLSVENEESSIEEDILRVKNALDLCVNESRIYENKTYKIYVKKEDGVEKRYGFFLVHRPDFSDGRYCSCHILVSSESDCLFVLNEKIYKSPNPNKSNKREKSMRIEDAIRFFEEKFFSATGIDWHLWCQDPSRGGIINNHCFYNQKYMLPLKINYELNDSEIAMARHKSKEKHTIEQHSTTAPSTDVLARPPIVQFYVRRQKRGRSF